MEMYNVYVGMDVHARSVTAQALNTDTGEIRKKRFGAGYGAAEIASWVNSLGRRVYCAYESGCTGVWLARDLRDLGIVCDVIAVSTLARSTKDKQEKCDKLDARALLREIANPLTTHSCVYIPTAKAEGRRDLCRIYTQTKDNAKRAKQELASFLCRHGYVWNEKTKTGKLRKPSGRTYEAWLSSIAFDDALTQEAFCILRCKKDVAQNELDQMRSVMDRLAKEEENAPFVDALCEIKGIDALNAMVVVSEFCDFERFASGRKVSSWLGTVPKNNSSGEKDAHGSITKAGNKYLRRTLTEGVCAISAWKRVPEKKRSDPPLATTHLARRANKRMMDRYHHLADGLGKNPNKAKTAIVNELVRWCWVIGRAVQEEMTR